MEWENHREGGENPREGGGDSQGGRGRFPGREQDNPREGEGEPQGGRGRTPREGVEEPQGGSRRTPGREREKLRNIILLLLHNDCTDHNHLFIHKMEQSQYCCK